jgi:hypothetical protein
MTISSIAANARTKVLFFISLSSIKKSITMQRMGYHLYIAPGLFLYRSKGYTLYEIPLHKGIHHQYGHNDDNNGRHL